MRNTTPNKTIIVMCVFGLILCPLFTGCTRISRPPHAIDPESVSGKMTVRESPLSKLNAELNAVAVAEPVNGKELVVRFPNVALFGSDERSLRPEAGQNLKSVADVLGRYPEFIVIVEGHTDSRGRESYNQWLSERRSRAVADFLVSKGLDPNRIQVVGYGQSRPIATNKTPEGREQNRRVELHIKAR